MFIQYDLVVFPIRRGNEEYGLFAVIPDNEDTCPFLFRGGYPSREEAEEGKAEVLESTNGELLRPLIEAAKENAGLKWTAAVA